MASATPRLGHMSNPKRGDPAKPGQDESATKEHPEDSTVKLIRIVVDDPLLWPVALVVFLIATTFGGMILLFAVRLRGLFAGVMLLMLLFLTVWGLDTDIRERRLRPQNRVVLCVWLGSALAAVVLEWLGASQ